MKRPEVEAILLCCGNSEKVNLDEAKRAKRRVE